MNIQSNNFLTSFDSPIQTHHVFGYMSGLQQQLGSFDYGQHLVVDALDQPGLTFELSDAQYHELMQAYREINIPADQWLFIDVEVDELNGVVGWTLVVLPYSLDYASYVIGCGYNREQVLAVFAFIGQLDSKALQSFMWALFSQPELAKRFVANPASRNHHHAYPGGLLEHSLECMQMVKAAMDQVSHFSKREKDLTQVAALLHDIGKTQTLSPNGELTTEGFNVKHEYYSLSVIADELKQLKKTYQQAAVALEYMLTWKLSDGYPKFIGANLIKAADRVSTGLQLREQAFAQLPEYFHFTQISTGARSVSLSRLN
ncbi:HD domain-containing protein [Thiomicrospira microaerophila]|uniref:HD domain-containing protein n=1 Tax=Thiomicrospira microaerophila TaxID=406020 RepID=UPI0005C8DBA3